VIDPSPADPHVRFRAALTRGFLLLDAAMGTRLLALGLRLDGDDPCLWNLDHPDAVASIHRADVMAGAGALLTNTFGANRAWLARLGRCDASPVAAINRAAVALARGASNPGVLVFGDIGPTAVDGGPGVVAEQAGALIGAGADALVFETHRLDRALAALADLDAATRARVPLVVSLLDWPDPPDGAIARLADLGASAIGGNCQDGMVPALALARRLRAATDLPLVVKPSAGLPGGAWHGPEAFARAVPDLRRLAPVLVGGCCGTTEAHVAALLAAGYDVHASRA
jgi:5-methyltetrahydrofolate--homocysteine methyltransferase